MAESAHFWRADSHCADSPDAPPPIELASSDDLIREHPGLSTLQLNRLIAEAGTNGLAEHVYRPRGPRGPVYIDRLGFTRWLRERARQAA